MILNETQQEKINDLSINRNLRKTSNQSQLDLDDILENKMYSSYHHFITEFVSKLRKTYLLETGSLSNPKLNEKGQLITKVLIDSQMIINCLISTCDFAKDKSERLFYRNYDNLTMNSDSYQFIKKVCADLQNEKYQLKIKNSRQIYNEIYSVISMMSSIRKLNENHSELLITNNEYVIDLKTKEKLDYVITMLSSDIVRINQNHYIEYDQLSDKDKLVFDLHTQQIERIFKDWSCNKSENKLFLLQICYSVIRGKGLNKFIVIKGIGGNGKSSYLNILKKLAGHGQYVLINADQWSNHNSLNQLSESTHVIIGDDAVKNQKMSSSGVANLKTVCTGQELDVNVKYEPNRKIKTNALYIQATNSDLQFFENNEALSRRLLTYNWDAQQYNADLAENTFDLESLIENQFFIDTLLTYVINHVNYFTSYDVPQSVIDSTKEMLSQSDSISQFMDDTLQMINKSGIVPFKLLFESFINWCQRMNPSAKYQKFQTFSKSLIEWCRVNNYEITNQKKRYTSLTTKMSLSKLLNIDNYKLDLYLRDQQFAIKFNTFTDTEISEFMSNFDVSRKYDDLSCEEIQLIAHLIFNEHHHYLNSLYSESF